MEILITKISKNEHKVAVVRQGGTKESTILDSRSFLRHDFAHFAVETEVPIASGYWGLVAAGASLSGEGFSGKGIALAEMLAGPTQTLMRIGAQPDGYLKLLQRTLPQMATFELAERIYLRAQSLSGHWKAIPFGDSMHIRWNA